MSNVTITHDLAGHGLTPHNIGEFAVRLPFPKYVYYIGTRTNWPGEPELSLIYALDGVEELRLFKRYALIVEKSSSYSWEELDPQITELLEQRHARILASRSEGQVQ